MLRKFAITIISLFLLASPVLATGTCDELRVVSGNNTFVPATVSFHARATDTASPIQVYRFYFGDGTQTDETSADTRHQYTVSGTFTARVEFKGANDAWTSSQACQTLFSLLTSPFESQKSGCSNIFVLGSNTVTAGKNVKFLITGYDNKSGIKQYKIDFGNGQVKQSNVGNFDLTFSQPGTYTIKGSVEDSKGNLRSADSCQTQLYVTGLPAQAGTPIVVQPSTGTPTWFTIAGIFSGILLFFLLQKKYNRNKKIT